MHSGKKTFGFLILLLVACRASAEIIRYQPEYSVDINSESKIYKSKVCFIGTNFWDTTGVRTLLTVAERQVPNQDCLNETCEADILGKMFETIGFNHSERAVLMTGLMEALMLVHNGEEVLNEMAKAGEFSHSYLHYFRPEDFPTVRNAVTWLSHLLGKPPREGFVDFDDVLSHIPLQVYHQDRYPVPFNVCEGSTVAFMSAQDLWGHVLKEGERSKMCICKGLDKTQTLASMRCQRVKEHRLPDRISTPGLTLTHELFHWTAVSQSSPYKQGIIDRLCASQSKGFLGKPQVAYGIRMAQELRRCQPWKSASNSDSYVFFLLEEYFQKRCGLKDWFQEETLDNISVNVGEGATAIFHDSLFEHPVRKVIHWKLIQEFVDRDPIWGLHVIESMFHSPYTFAFRIVCLCISTIATLTLLWAFWRALWRILWRAFWLTRSTIREDPKHPQHYLGFESTSRYMYLNGRLVARDDVMLQKIQQGMKH